MLRAVSQHVEATGTAAARARRFFSSPRIPPPSYYAVPLSSLNSLTCNFATASLHPQSSPSLETRISRERGSVCTIFLGHCARYARRSSRSESGAHSAQAARPIGRAGVGCTVAWGTAGHAGAARAGGGAPARGCDEAERARVSVHGLTWLSDVGDRSEEPGKRVGE